MLSQMGTVAHTVRGIWGYSQGKGNYFSVLFFFMGNQSCRRSICHIDPYMCACEYVCVSVSVKGNINMCGTRSDALS